jgi:signal transduction histidine kinase/ActR/RegA family two-component response regulator
MIAWVKRNLEKYVFADELSLERRNLNTILLAGFLVAASCVAVRFLSDAPILSIIIQSAFMLMTMLAALLINKFRMIQFTIYSTIIILNFVLFPLNFFVNGGFNSAAAEYFVIGFVITIMQLSGRKAIIFVIIQITVTIICYTLAWNYPQLVVKVDNQNVLMDHIVSFLAVAVFFAIIFKVQNTLYVNERERSRVAVDVLIKNTQLRRFVNNIAVNLLNIDDDNFEVVLKQSMATIAKQLDMDRVFIFNNVEDGDDVYFVATYRWVGDDHPDDTVIRLPYKDKPAWHDMLSAGQTIHGPAASLDSSVRPILDYYKIASTIVVPVYWQNRFEGFVMFNDYRNERSFPDDLIDIVRAAALIIYNAVIRDDIAKSLAKAHAEALFANNAKSDFLSNMSHEIRTPMNAIIGMIDIARKTDDVERKNYSLGKMSEASNHLLSIINDVLDMSKIEANKLELSPVDFSFKNFIDKINTVSAFQVKSKRQHFVVDIDPAIPDMLRGDEQRLSQVIANLMSNAVKFTPDEGEIRLEARLLASEKDMHKVRITVIDTGIGISEEHQSILFHPFQQAENDTSRRYGGTGLGLAISKRIIDLMSGAIEIKSEPGRGSSFAVTIPLASASSDVSLSPPGGAEADGVVNAGPEPDEFAGRRLLLAEDIELNREILITMLEDSGIEIDCAANGAEALALFEKDPDRYDLIFMDIQMPEMDGYEATKRIRALGDPHALSVPIIALTANVFKEDVDKSIEAGMNSHLGKPLSLSDITLKLRKYLKTH